MIDRRFNIRHDLTDPDDLRLKKLLQQWHGLEPRSDFEFRVWRRIRATAAEESTAPGPWVILRGWLTRLGEVLRRSLAAEPAWVPAMTATAGLLVGVALALSAPQTPADPYSAASLLHSQTLAGAYLTMVSGGAR